MSNSSDDYLAVAPLIARDSNKPGSWFLVSLGGGHRELEILPADTSVYPFQSADCLSYYLIDGLCGIQ